MIDSKDLSFKIVNWKRFPTFLCCIEMHKSSKAKGCLHLFLNVIKLLSPGKLLEDQKVCQANKKNLYNHQLMQYLICTKLYFRNCRNIVVKNTQKYKNKNFAEQTETDERRKYAELNTMAAFHLMSTITRSEKAMLSP